VYENVAEVFGFILKCINILKQFKKYKNIIIPEYQTRLRFPKNNSSIPFPRCKQRASWSKDSKQNKIPSPSRDPRWWSHLMN
jgi:hypothetical protein